MSATRKQNPVVVWGIVLAAVVVAYSVFGVYLRIFKGPLLLIGALLAITWLHRRNFERTNHYGNEVHPTFIALLKHRTVEGIVFTLAWAAALFGLVLSLPVIGAVLS